MRGKYDRHATRAERWARQRTALNGAVARAVASRGEKTTVRDICAAAGVGRNTFYQHFRDIETARRIAIDQAGAALELTLRRLGTAREIAAIALRFATEDAVRRALLLTTTEQAEEPFSRVLERAFASKNIRAARAVALAGAALAILRRYEKEPPPATVSAIFE